MNLSNMSVINSHSASVHGLLDKDSRPSGLYLFKTEEQINLTLDLHPGELPPEKKKNEIKQNKMLLTLNYLNMLPISF